MKIHSINRLSISLLCIGILHSAHANPGYDDELVALNNESTKSVRESAWYKASQQTRDARLAWWTDARFGCMMHWGAYSALGGEYEGKQITGVPGYAEQIMRQAKITVADYKENVVKKFNPQKFNADEWCQLLSEAGMKYLVITAKHHDGFAVWQSDVNDYDMGMTPFKRDPMMELKKACDKFGIKLGFYYSQAQEWSHPYGTYNRWEFNHPVNSGGCWYLQTKNKEHALNVGKYFDEVAIPHVLELSRKYDPAIFWFDVAFCAPQWENNRLLKALRAENPNVIVNSRIGADLGDYLSTNDKAIEFRLLDAPWEGIPTTTESYGYHKFDKTHKKPEELIEVLIKATAKSGNTMLNVGPKGDGTIDAADADVLRGIGAWLKINGESIRGCGYSGLPAQSWGQITTKGNNLYLHILQKPADGMIKLYGLTNNLLCASSLKSGSVLNTEQAANICTVSVSEELLQENIPVIKLTYEGNITPSSRQYIIANMKNKLHVFEAQVSGPEKGFTYGSGQEESEYIYRWKNSDTYPEWQIDVEQAGNYDIDIYFDKPKKMWNQPEIHDEADFKLLKDNAVIASFRHAGKGIVTLENVKLNGKSTLALQIDQLIGEEAGLLKYLVIKRK
ncbi:alpha-L-fucosidase [Pontiella sulfatireligans]|uniref:alpha-L-fucosidase n=1 Tax=Pontiella sulfatireligans TaxID=2750658 RepID=A0A6C2ULF1_9BACT|nr:alpha-L-fucosidase [Pontiella sulfatireligans]VGO20799.1 hypothetical protein SCARR_02866 [Pontiella sulfatireligans]